MSLSDRSPSKAPTPAEWFSSSKLELTMPESLEPHALGPLTPPNSYPLHYDSETELATNPRSVFDFLQNESPPPPIPPSKSPSRPVMAEGYNVATPKPARVNEWDTPTKGSRGSPYPQLPVIDIVNDDENHDHDGDVDMKQASREGSTSPLCRNVALCAIDNIVSRPKTSLELNSADRSGTTTPIITAASHAHPGTAVSNTTTQAKFYQTPPNSQQGAGSMFATAQIYTTPVQARPAPPNTPTIPPRPAQSKVAAMKNMLQLQIQTAAVPAGTPVGAGIAGFAKKSVTVGKPPLSPGVGTPSASQKHPGTPGTAGRDPKGRHVVIVGEGVQYSTSPAHHSVSRTVKHQERDCDTSEQSVCQGPLGIVVPLPVQRGGEAYVEHSPCYPSGVARPQSFLTSFCQPEGNEGATDIDPEEENNNDHEDDDFCNTDVLSDSSSDIENIPPTLLYPLQANKLTDYRCYKDSSKGYRKELLATITQLTTLAEATKQRAMLYTKQVNSGGMDLVQELGVGLQFVDETRMHLDSIEFLLKKAEEELKMYQVGILCKGAKRDHGIQKEGRKGGQNKKAKKESIGERRKGGKVGVLGKKVVGVGV